MSDPTARLDFVVDQLKEIIQDNPDVFVELARASSARAVMGELALLVFMAMLAVHDLPAYSLWQSWDELKDPISSLESCIASQLGTSSESAFSSFDLSSFVTDTPMHSLLAARLDSRALQNAQSKIRDQLTTERADRACNLLQRLNRLLNLKPADAAGQQALHLTLSEAFELLQLHAVQAALHAPYAPTASGQDACLTQLQTSCPLTVVGLALRDGLHFARLLTNCRAFELGADIDSKEQQDFLLLAHQCARLALHSSANKAEQQKWQEVWLQVEQGHSVLASV